MRRIAAGAQLFRTIQKRRRCAKVTCSKGLGYVGATWVAASWIGRTGGPFPGRWRYIGAVASGIDRPVDPADPVAGEPDDRNALTSVWIVVTNSDEGATVASP